MDEDEKYYNELVEGYKNMPDHDAEDRKKLQAYIDGLIDAEKKKYEIFFKLLPLHMKLVDSSLSLKLKNYYDNETDLEKATDILSEMATFLINKLHDIKIDSIRHGILKESDFEQKEMKHEDSL